jgi:hypothetical protein
MFRIGLHGSCTNTLPRRWTRGWRSLDGVVLDHTGPYTPTDLTTVQYRDPRLTGRDCSQCDVHSTSYVRYPIGFSGDTYMEWSTLQFQPSFTAAAANVLFWYTPLPTKQSVRPALLAGPFRKFRFTPRPGLVSSHITARTVLVRLEAHSSAVIQVEPRYWWAPVALQRRSI